MAVPKDPPPHTTTLVCAAMAGDRRIRQRANQSSSSMSSSLKLPLRWGDGVEDGDEEAEELVAQQCMDGWAEREI